MGDTSERRLKGIQNKWYKKLLTQQGEALEKLKKVTQEERTHTDIQLYTKMHAHLHTLQRENKDLKKYSSNEV